MYEIHLNNKKGFISLVSFFIIQKINFVILTLLRLYVTYIFAVNLHDKTKHVIHIKNLKQAFNNGLELDQFYRIQ